MSDNTLQAIQAMALEYPREVGNSALLAEWVERELR